MKLINIKAPSETISFKEALFHPIADDGGLYLPETIKPFSKEIIENIKNLSFHEISTLVVNQLLGNETFKAEDLQRIIKDAFNFPVPTKTFNDQLSILELFHGPTMAFKDFGARFMARAMSTLKGPKQKIKILVATSGDTGGAVASGFYNFDDVEIFILYPKNMVSPLQERQMTTLGGNVHALEVSSNFDQCQDIVKKCFQDSELIEAGLTTANSINISRLVPQVTYYFESYKNLSHFDNLIFCVPSGNFGDITAGLIAKKLGLPVKHFIAANNSNKPVVDYLKTGTYHAEKAIPTLSNAMDIGNPSNFSRFAYLLDNDFESIKKELSAFSISDAETIETIKEFYRRHQYLLDPHGAVGLAAAEKYLAKNSNNHICVLETAHPCKFEENSFPLTGISSDMPEQVQTLSKKPVQKISIAPDYETIKEIILG